MTTKEMSTTNRAQHQWERIYRHLGITSVAVGEHGTCPLCQAPSGFVLINRVRGKWQCGSCGASGAGVGLVAQVLGIKQSEASERISVALDALGVSRYAGNTEQADQEDAPLAGVPACNENTAPISTDGEYRQRPRIRPQSVTPRLDISAITEAATGQWESILPALGIAVPKRGRHGPCPVCGGTDRFHFDDKKGDGGWYCRQCDGKNYGDGLDLVVKVTGKSNKEAAQEVAQVLGLVSGVLDYEAIDQRQAQAARRAEQEKAQEQARRKQAASQAAELVSQGQHSAGAPYLVGKGLNDWSAMRLSGPLNLAGIGFAAGDLLVPLHNQSGELVNVQIVSAQGEKRYLAGGQKAGAFHRIEGGELVAVCEGYATGLSVHLAMGATVYCAMDCGNLLAVANIARAHHPKSRIILAADNDAHTEGNPGKTKAEQAAAKVGGLVALPDEPGDWDDYRQAHGLDLTKAALLTVSDKDGSPDANQEDALTWQADTKIVHTLDTPEDEAQMTAQQRQRGMTMAQPLRLVQSEPVPRPALAQMAASQRAELLHERLGVIAIHQASGVVHRHDGALWSRISDDELGRLMADIFDEHQTPYSDKAIVSAVKVLRMRIPVMGEQAEHLIGFANGVYDLTAQRFRPHRPNDWLLSHNGITFTESQDGEHLEAHAPHFHRWLNHAADNDPTKMERIKAALFMILAGRHDWQLFIEVTGAGGSGKSIFSRIASMLVGSHNMASGNTRTLDEARGRAQFVGKRLIVLPDQPKYIGDGSGIKAITGGDLVEIDGKYEKQFSTVLKAVILITNNDPMVFTERNGGIARRRVIFSFEHVVAEAQKDPQLGDKIAAELPVIIRHLLAGFADQDRARSLLHEQRASADALAVKRATDPVLDMCAAVMFLETATEMMMGGGKYVKLEPRQYLYHLYLEYMEFHGLGKPLSVDRFSTAVRNAAKEYGGKYLTRKVKGRTQTNVQATDLIEGFMMTAANCAPSQEETPHV